MLEIPADSADAEEEGPEGNWIVQRLREFLPLSREEEVEVSKVTGPLKELARGRCLDYSVGVAAVLVVRRRGEPVKWKELAGELELSPRSLRRCALAASSVLDIEVPAPRFDPIQVIEPVAEKAGVAHAAPAALKLVRDAIEAGFSPSGKNPWGIAAAAIYMAVRREGKQVATQAELAQAACVTEVTLRTRLKEIKKALGLTKR
ncbi:MAG: hypothetical protein Kow0069_17830 [Promethearchaeota archaeon]